jgi:elongation factor 1 alpha-like protein
MRFVVTDAYQEGRGVVARGRVVQGFLRVGERAVVLPIGDVTTVSKLDHLQPPSGSAERLAIAQAGDTVDLVLNGIDLMRLSVGNILANQNALPPICRKATAKILVMDNLNVPMIRGAQVLFHMHSLDIPAVLTKLIFTTNRDGSIKKERPRALTSGASAVVELTLSAGICMEPFSECRALGRFVLRRGGDTVAVGVIDELVQ